MPKKNVDLLVEMMKYLPEENLLIVGNWSRKSGQTLYRKIQETNTGNIYTLPNVTEEEKAALYKACRAFLFPSLCEGFGMPPIEAMKFGKPVFLSTLTSLPEIGGDAAFYWKDLTPKAMAETVKERMAFFCSLGTKIQLFFHINGKNTYIPCSEPGLPENGSF